MTETTKTIKFKKRTKRKNANSIGSLTKHNKEDEIEDSNSENDENVMARIQETKRKRKLLETKRGIDVEKEFDINSIKTPKPIENSANVPEKITKPQPGHGGNLQDKLRGTFSGVDSSGDGHDGSDQTMQKKHAQAMEDYIQQNLGSGEDEQQKKKQEQQQVEVRKSAEDRLYEELLKDTQNEGGADNDNTDAPVEGDIGSGGAMLGGTGIAEVILPSNFRQSNHSSSNDGNIDLASYVPTNFTKGPAKSRYHISKKQLPTSSSTSQTKITSKQPDNNNLHSNKLASNAPSSYSHNFKLHKHEWIQQQKKKEQDAVASQNKTITTTVDDQDRVGFQASRSKNNDDYNGGDSQSSSGGQRKKEDKYWNQFVSKQRNQRPFY